MSTPPTPSVQPPAWDDSTRSRPIGWTVDGLSFVYPGATRATLLDVSLDIRPGECTAILGPNGSGKSTLVRLLLGTLAPERGSVLFATRPLSEWTRRDLARMVGVVPQREEIAFPLTVRDMVAMGRYPHLGLFRPETAGDRAAVEMAMGRCDVLPLRDRLFDTLSGGERQRARLARALAQEPRALALDEPTRALDVRHEMLIFEQLRELASSGVTVVLVTHSLNLASRYADRLVLLNQGRVAGCGRPHEILRQDLLEAVYGWPLLTTRHPGPGRDSGATQVTPLSLESPRSFPAQQ